MRIVPLGLSVAIISAACSGANSTNSTPTTSPSPSGGTVASQSLPSGGSQGLGATGGNPSITTGASTTGGNATAATTVVLTSGGNSPGATTTGGSTSTPIACPVGTATTTTESFTNEVYAGMCYQFSTTPPHAACVGTTYNTDGSINTVTGVGTCPTDNILTTCQNTNYFDTTGTQGTMLLSIYDTAQGKAAAANCGSWIGLVTDGMGGASSTGGSSGGGTTRATGGSLATGGSPSTGGATTSHATGGYPGAGGSSAVTTTVMSCQSTSAITDCCQLLTGFNTCLVAHGCTVAVCQLPSGTGGFPGTGGSSNTGGASTTGGSQGTGGALTTGGKSSTGGASQGTGGSTLVEAEYNACINSCYALGGICEIDPLRASCDTCLTNCCTEYYGAHGAVTC